MPEASGPLFTAAARVCGVCTTRFAQYKCPRCAVAYCSLGCYRSHGEQCTEAFFKEQAQRELRSMSASDEQAQGMMRTLQRFEDQQHGTTPWASEAGVEEDGDEAEAESRGEGECEGEGEGEDEEVGGNDDDAERLVWMLEQATLNEEQLPPELRAEVRLPRSDCSTASYLPCSFPAYALLTLCPAPSLLTIVILPATCPLQFRRLVADGSLGASMQAAPAWWERLPPSSVVLTRSGWRFASEQSEAAASAWGAPSLPTPPPLTQLTRKHPPARCCPCVRYTPVGHGMGSISCGVCLPFARQPSFQPDGRSVVVLLHVPTLLWRAARRPTAGG
jgi:hypothetical protein